MKSALVFSVAFLYTVSAEVTCIGNPALTTSWCNSNCNNIPAFCPSSICTCGVVEPVTDGVGCGVVTGSDVGVFGKWCLDNCYRTPAFCPANRCSCSTVTPPFNNPFIAAYFLDGQQSGTSSTREGSCFTWFATNFSRFITRCVHEITDISVAHVHRNVFGANGPVVHAFTPAQPVMNLNTDVSVNGLSDFLNGNLYVNIHTPTFPAGEIRGQIARVQNGPNYANFYLFPSASFQAGGACGGAVRQNPRNADNFDLIVACLHNIPPATVTSASIRNGSGAILFSFPVGTAPFIEGRFTLTETQFLALVSESLTLDITSPAGTISAVMTDNVRTNFPLAGVVPESKADSQ